MSRFARFFVMIMILNVVGSIFPINKVSGQTITTDSADYVEIRVAKDATISKYSKSAFGSWKRWQEIFDRNVAKGYLTRNDLTYHSVRKWPLVHLDVGQKLLVPRLSTTSVEIASPKVKSAEQATVTEVLPLEVAKKALADNRPLVANIADESTESSLPLNTQKQIEDLRKQAIAGSGIIIRPEDLPAATPTVPENLLNEKMVVSAEPLIQAAPSIVVEKTEQKNGLTMSLSGLTAKTKVSVDNLFNRLVVSSKLWLVVEAAIFLALIALSIFWARLRAPVNQDEKVQENGVSEARAPEYFRRAASYICYFSKETPVEVVLGKYTGFVRVHYPERDENGGDIQRVKFLWKAEVYRGVVMYNPNTSNMLFWMKNSANRLEPTNSFIGSLFTRFAASTSKVVPATDSKKLAPIQPVMGLREVLFPTDSCKFEFVDDKLVISDGTRTVEFGSGWALRKTEKGFTVSEPSEPDWAFVNDRKESVAA